ncbi:MAG: hypothetical protein MUO72_19985 [Bacteroidales bacterium]|nr:hypothetical protein [Bacteroidales bacterium]
MARSTSRKQHEILINDPRILSIEDAAYRENIAPFRSLYGLPALPEIKKVPVSFSGKWTFNEERSILDNFGFGNLPEKIEITQTPSDIKVKKTMKRGNQSFDMASSEKWNLQEKGKVFVVRQSSTTFRGKRLITLFYNKE